MGRPRSKPLPPGLYTRGKVIWCSFYDQHGQRVQERAGTTVEEARRHLAQRERQVAGGGFERGAGTGERTVATYAATWVRLRREEGVRSADREEQLLRDHILPHLGRLRLVDVRPRDVATWIRAIAPGLSPKSVRNAHGVLSALFARARFDELVTDNPAKGLPRGVLPKNARTREVGAWSRSEVEALLSDPRIPEDRRVAYAIAAFTGARVGEVAGMRWRDLDTKAGPLWRWSLRSQYDGQRLKTDSPRDVPIHDELRRVLEAWKAEGWERLVLRPPVPEDFVVPREDGTVHSKQSMGSKAVHRHAALVGLSSAGRDFHSFRRSMITFCREDGAREDVLERITHNAKGAMIDAYTYFGWGCSATPWRVSSCRRPPAPRRPPVTVAVTRTVRMTESASITGRKWWRRRESKKGRGTDCSGERQILTERRLGKSA